MAKVERKRRHTKLLEGRLSKLSKFAGCWRTLVICVFSSENFFCHFYTLGQNYIYCPIYTWPKVTSFDVSPRTKAMINASPLNPPLDARWRNEKPSSKRHLHQTIHFLKPSLAAEHWIHFRYFFVISMKLSGKILLTVRWRTAYLSKHRPKTRSWSSASWYSLIFI